MVAPETQIPKPYTLNSNTCLRTESCEFKLEPNEAGDRGLGLSVRGLGFRV